MSSLRRTGVRYRAVADWGVLGKKLRKDIGRVKNAFPSVSGDQIYLKSGTLMVDGIEPVEDLTVQRYTDLPNGSDQYGTHNDNVRNT
jgi:isoleucyl-tRNA synthetase